MTIFVTLKNLSTIMQTSIYIIILVVALAIALAIFITLHIIQRGKIAQLATQISLSEQELQLLEAFRRMSEEQRAQLLRQACTQRCP